MFTHFTVTLYSVPTVTFIRLGRWSLKTWKWGVAFRILWMGVEVHFNRILSFEERERLQR